MLFFLLCGFEFSNIGFLLLFLSLSFILTSSYYRLSPFMIQMRRIAVLTSGTEVWHIYI